MKLIKFKFCLVILLTYIGLTDTFGFQDKNGREIILEWDTSFSETDKILTFKSYESQKEHYSSLNINYDEFFSNLNLEAENELETEKKLSLENSERTYYLIRAKFEDATCGYAYYIKEDSLGTSFFLELIALHPDYQKAGIGKHLVFEIQKKFPCTKISLITRIFNLNAQTFYEHIGFCKKTDENKENENYIEYEWKKLTY